MESSGIKLQNAEPKLKIGIYLSLILLAGGFLRLANLGEPSFWVDEVNTFYSARSLAEQGNYAMPSGLEHNRSPLHLHLTALVFRAAGADTFTTRLVSAVFGIFTIVLVYLFGKKFFNWKAGVAAAFFTAFSHFEIGWSRTARAYTVLQFATLLFAYFMLLALEYRKNEDVHSLLTVKGDSLLRRMRMFTARWGLYTAWLLPAAVTLAAGYLYVHKLAVFWAASVFVYAVIMAVVAAAVMRGREKFFNSYFLIAAGMLAAGIAAYAGLPQVRTAVSYFLAYTPSWAQGIAAEGNRLNLVNFLLSPYRMPLLTLFFIGSVQAFFRYNARAVFIFVMFSCQLFLLCFVFTHNTQTYLFNVYPFFLMLAAYGFTNIINVETLVSRELLSKEAAVSSALLRKFEKHTASLITAALFGIFIVTPWLRVSLHIPFNSDGFTNGAVTPAGWKSGSAIIKEQLQEKDAVISSLPAISIYYGTGADYALNWSLLEQAREKNFRGSDGAFREIYGGAPCITGIDHLEQVIGAHAAGWIIIESYHWEHQVYVPGEIKEYLLQRLGDPVTAADGSIYIFHWDDEKDTI